MSVSASKLSRFYALTARKSEGRGAHAASKTLPIEPEQHIGKTGWVANRGPHVSDHASSAATASLFKDCKTATAATVS